MCFIIQIGHKRYKINKKKVKEAAISAGLIATVIGWIVWFVGYWYMWW